MLYYRRPSETGPRAWRPGRVRALTSFILAGYPAGCLMRLVAGAREALWLDVFGFALVFASLAAFGFLSVHALQRISGEETARLDERELAWRRRAYGFSYVSFTGIALLAIIYLALAADAPRFALWRPQSYEHWNAVFWGVFLTAATLPTAYLAWTLAPPEQTETAEPA